MSLIQLLAQQQRSDLDNKFKSVYGCYPEEYAEKAYKQGVEEGRRLGSDMAVSVISKVRE